MMKNRVVVAVVTRLFFQQGRIRRARSHAHCHEPAAAAGPQGRRRARFLASVCVLVRDSRPPECCSPSSCPTRASRPCGSGGSMLGSPPTTNGWRSTTCGTISEWESRREGCCCRAALRRFGLRVAVVWWRLPSRQNHNKQSAHNTANPEARRRAVSGMFRYYVLCTWFSSPRVLSGRAINRPRARHPTISLSLTTNSFPFRTTPAGPCTVSAVFSWE